MSEPKQARWRDLDAVALTDRIAVKVVSGEKLMIAEFTLKAGAYAAPHRHDNEQATWVLRGAMRVVVAGVDHVLRDGDILVIPAGTLHEVFVLEDTLEIDVFSPIREEWADGPKPPAYFAPPED
jgi:quercetin dioxygenase-like cupin family protein